MALIYLRLYASFEVAFIQRGEFFHNSTLEKLTPGMMYHYRILAASGSGFRSNLRFILMQEGCDPYFAT